jgi:hypothetical protein
METIAAIEDRRSIRKFPDKKLLKTSLKKYRRVQEKEWKTQQNGNKNRARRRCA